MDNMSSQIQIQKPNYLGEYFTNTEKAVFYLGQKHITSFFPEKQYLDVKLA